MLSEIAEHFSGSTSGAFDALERVGVTLKKNFFILIPIKKTGKIL